MTIYTKMKWGTSVTAAIASVIAGGYVWMNSATPYINTTDFYEIFQGTQERCSSTIYDNHTEADITRLSEQGQWYVDELGRTWKQLTNGVGATIITNTFPYYTNRLVLIDDFDMIWGNRVVTNVEHRISPSYAVSPVNDVNNWTMSTTNKQIVSSNSTTFSVAQCWTNVIMTNVIGAYIDEDLYTVSAGLSGKIYAWGTGAAFVDDQVYSGNYSGLSAFPSLTLSNIFVRNGIALQTNGTAIFHDLTNSAHFHQIITKSNWVERYIAIRESKWMNGSDWFSPTWDESADNYKIYRGEGTTWEAAKTACVEQVYSQRCIFDQSYDGSRHEVELAPTGDSGDTLYIFGGVTPLNGTAGLAWKPLNPPYTINYMAIRIVSRAKVSPYFEPTTPYWYDLSTNQSAKIDYYVRSYPAEAYIEGSTNALMNTYNSYYYGAYDNAELDLWMADYDKAVSTNNRPNSPELTLEPDSWCQEPVYDSVRDIAGRSCDGNYWDSVDGVVKWDYEYCTNNSIVVIP